MYLLSAVHDFCNLCCTRIDSDINLMVCIYKPELLCLEYVLSNTFLVVKFNSRVNSAEKLYYKNCAKIKKRKTLF